MDRFNGYAAPSAGAPLERIAFAPPTLRRGDVEIEVSHCGVCHSDLHLVDDDWRMSSFPFVPGHEVVGRVVAVGDDVEHLAVGDRVGVGWQSGACHHCDPCVDGNENLCQTSQPTCVGRNGGFADRLRTSAAFAFQLPDALDAAASAPLLCGGVTVHAPLARYARPGDRVGVIGIGGLGHMAIRFAAAMGTRVTAFSGSPDKESEARAMGATDFANGRDRGTWKDRAGAYDVIVSTVFAPLDWGAIVSALRPTGTLVLVGAPSEPLSIPAFALLARRQIAGSAIGSRAEIRDMLTFAAHAGVDATVETFAMSDVNEALARVRSGAIRYRAVLTN